jgi:hypothetical protein
MVKELWDIIKNLFTRKYSSPFHLALGLIIAFGYLYAPGLAITLFVLFAVVELWQSIAYWYFGIGRSLDFEVAHYNDQGYTDFWECLVGVSVGIFLIIMLRIGGIL